MVVAGAVAEAVIYDLDATHVAMESRTNRIRPVPFLCHLIRSMNGSVGGIVVQWRWYREPSFGM